MLKALDNIKPDWYTPLAERDSTTPTRFYIRALNGVEVLNVKWGFDANGNSYLTSEAAAWALSKGLMGWENLLEKDGSPVEFNPLDRDANLKRIPGELVVELSREIWIRSRLSEEERKNLLSLLTSRPSSAPLSTAASADAAGDATATTQTPPALQSGASQT